MGYFSQTQSLPKLNTIDLSLVVVVVVDDDVVVFVVVLSQKPSI